MKKNKKRSLENNNISFKKYSKNTVLGYPGSGGFLNQFLRLFMAPVI